MKTVLYLTTFFICFSFFSAQAQMGNVVLDGNGLVVTQKPNQNGITISWTTTLQEYNDEFIVCRVTNGLVSEIGRINGDQFSSTSKSYTFEDYFTGSSQNVTYRLKFKESMSPFWTTHLASKTITYTGIQDHNAIKYEVYPSFTSSNIVIEIDDEFRSANYFVFNSSGQEVLTGSLIENTNTINLSELNIGNYFIKLQNEKGVSAVSKLMKTN